VKKSSLFDETAIACTLLAASSVVPETVIAAGSSDFLSSAELAVTPTGIPGTWLYATAYGFAASDALFDTFLAASESPRPTLGFAFGDSGHGFVASSIPGPSVAQAGTESVPGQSLAAVFSAIGGTAVLRATAELGRTESVPGRSLVAVSSAIGGTAVLRATAALAVGSAPFNPSVSLAVIERLPSSADAGAGGGVPTTGIAGWLWILIVAGVILLATMGAMWAVWARRGKRKADDEPSVDDSVDNELSFCQDSLAEAAMELAQADFGDLLADDDLSEDRMMTSDGDFSDDGSADEGRS
jgi:hypothetical protein